MEQLTIDALTKPQPLSVSEIIDFIKKGEVPPQILKIEDLEVGDILLEYDRVIIVDEIADDNSYFLGRLKTYYDSSFFPLSHQYNFDDESLSWCEKIDSKYSYLPIRNNIENDFQYYHELVDPVKKTDKEWHTQLEWYRWRYKEFKNIELKKNQLQQENTRKVR